MTEQGGMAVLLSRGVQVESGSRLATHSGRSLPDCTLKTVVRLVLCRVSAAASPRLVTWGDVSVRSGGTALTARSEMLGFHLSIVL